MFISKQLLVVDLMCEGSKVRENYFEQKTSLKHCDPIYATMHQRANDIKHSTPII